MEKMTELELLQDTIDWYGKDPLNRRSVEKGSNDCTYNGPDGKHCAVGRFLMPRFKKQGDDFRYNSGFGASLLFQNMDAGFMQRKVKDIPVRFWNDLQSLHDDADSWDYTSGGLSAIGKRWVERMCKNHDLSVYELNI